MKYKVYVILGFHTSFYHSWRGDTPDEAGFGTDIRVVRGILDILDQASVGGKKARGYWDMDVYWTFQEIIPKHCPDILERMRKRVAAGLDEIVLGPFNNGANHAATADEFRAALSWAIENPWGSGLRQLFPEVTPFYRPQESMFTTGQEAILTECGVQGLMLYYATVPFNTLSAFIPTLSLQERYNPLWFRTSPDQPKLVLFPCLSAGDVIDLVSMENAMLDLHERQLRGEIQSDVVIHLNEDADLETWLPLKLPHLVRWFPNTGGLAEYIHLVNKYDWADFTVPSEYLATHPPHKEILVRQDLADGAFDGSYSWAEKCTSLRTWTILEQSRLASYRAERLARRSHLDLRKQLWEGMDSSFFKRLIGLTTTHFGMSTPVINEERQRRADAILGEGRSIAQSAEREAAKLHVAIEANKEAAQRSIALEAECKTAGQSIAQEAEFEAAKRMKMPARESLYEFGLFTTPPGREAPVVPTRTAVKVPLILPDEVKHILLEEVDGTPVQASLTDCVVLPDGRTSCQLRFIADFTGHAGNDPKPDHSKRYRLHPANVASEARPVISLKNKCLEVQFSEQTGVQSFKLDGREIGGTDFLQPFISYRTRKKPVVYPPTQWKFLPLTGEKWDGLQRLRLQAILPMQTPFGEYSNRFTYTFTLLDELPQLYVDVEARFAYTPPTETIHNMVQKLRRLIDLRWVEVAPFQLHPRLEASGEKPLRVWKHNYLGVTAWYELNYGKINPHNRNLDAFNHQVTAGWVAVTDGKQGLLLSEDAEVLASMAFCPMRLREVQGRQQLWLNPFGSYHGKMLDYSHLGGSGMGVDFVQAFSGALKPNGPSYNGQMLCFSLMLAPYVGDEPLEALQAGAAAHFYPPGVVFHTVPDGMQALLPEDIRTQTAQALRQAQLESDIPLPAPTAFLANPAPGQVGLVWDLPRAVAITGGEVAWHEKGDVEWQITAIPTANHWQVTGLVDGREYHFKVRLTNGQRFSEWTQEQTCIAGAVTGGGLGGFGAIPLHVLLSLVASSLWTVVRARLRKKV
jgi:hypothetical protein